MRSHCKRAIWLRGFPAGRRASSTTVLASSIRGMRALRAIRPFAATALLWIAAVSLVHAQSCYVYNAAVGNMGSPWETTSQQAANWLVAQCNSNAQGWRACFAQNEGWCNALPGYTCTAEMPPSIPTPAYGYPVSVPMTVVMSSPNGIAFAQEYLGLGAAAVNPCNEYFVQAPPTTPATADQGRPCPACKNGPDPVNPSTGNESLTETDVERMGSNGGLSFKRYYNSLNTTSTDMGPGWQHSFSRYLKIQTITLGSSTVSSAYSTQAAACTSGWAQISSSVPGFQSASASYSNGICTVSNGSAVLVLPVLSTLSTPGSSLTEVLAYRDDGHVVAFTSNDQSFAAEPGSGYQLLSSGNYQLIDDQDNVETYNPSGKLLSIADRDGNVLALAYNASTGLLTSVTDFYGLALTFTYDSQNRLQTVVIPNNSSVQYAYNSAGDLSTVTNLDGSTRQFQYSDPHWPTGLSGVVDESTNTEFTLAYDSQGRVVSSTLGGVSSSLRLTYNSDGSTTETDPLGAVRTFASLQVGEHEFNSAVSGAPCYACGYVAATTYDAGGFPATETDFNGTVTAHTYDDSRGLEISRTEGSGTSAARTITTQWNVMYRLPTLISVYAGGSATGTPLRTTSFSYDGTGNLLTKTLTDPATGVTRTWTYTYGVYGRLVTAADPRGNVTTFAYYTCTTV